MKPRVIGWLSAGLLCTQSALAQTYVVGVEEQSFQPHYWQDEKGDYRGFAREVLDLFAQEAGIELQYKALPVERFTTQLASGAVDFKYPDSPGWGGQAKFDKNIQYSQPVVDYVDGVLVPPKQLGQGVDGIKRLALVEGWTPRDYLDRISSGQTAAVRSGNLAQMMRLALRKEADGVYYNVVVATFYLDNIRARPGALVFDPSLPHGRGSFLLSSQTQPQLIEQFDHFLQEHRQQLDELKAKNSVER